jgi:hypothetical protein
MWEDERGALAGSGGEICIIKEYTRGQGSWNRRKRRSEIITDGRTFKIMCANPAGPVVWGCLCVPKQRRAAARMPSQVPLQPLPLPPRPPSPPPPPPPPSISRACTAVDMKVLPADYKSVTTNYGRLKRASVQISVVTSSINTIMNIIMYIMSMISLVPTPLLVCGVAYTVVTLVSHCCYTVVTLLSHCCHPVVTLLLHCCVRSISRAGGSWIWQPANL